MNNVRLIYNIIDTTVDKDKPYYVVKDNVIYIRDKSLFDNKYYLEADYYSPTEGRKLIIILSKEKIDSNCRQCKVDNYGRLKIKPVAHREYLQAVYSRDSNIQFVLDSMNDEFVAYRI